MIPKVIHFCWFGGKPLPADVKKCIKSWRKYCPDYKIIKWDESNFDVKSHSFIADAYSNKAWAFVSDYARLKIVYENGGIYLDTDVELFRSPNFLLEYDSFLALQQNRMQCNTGLGFGAIRESELIRMMMDEYNEVEFDNNNRFDIRCPIMNTNAIIKAGFVQKDIVQTVNNNILLPPKYMDPVTPGDYENLMCEDTLSIHHYSATWMSGTHQIKRKIINVIGQDYINKIKRIIKK